MDLMLSTFSESHSSGDHLPASLCEASKHSQMSLRSPRCPNPILPSGSCPLSLLCLTARFLQGAVCPHSAVFSAIHSVVDSITLSHTHPTPPPWFSPGRQRSHCHKSSTHLLDCTSLTSLFFRHSWILCCCAFLLFLPPQSLLLGSFFLHLSLNYWCFHGPSFFLTSHTFPM